MATLINTVNKFFKKRTSVWANRDEREQYRQHMDEMRTEMYTTFV